MANKSTQTQAIAGGIWKATSRQLDEAKQIIGSNIGYGIAVVYTGVEGEVQAPDDGNQLGNGATTPAANEFAGFTMIQREPFDENLEIDGYSKDIISAPVGQGQTTFVSENDALTVLRQGFIGVKVEAIAAAGDPVYFRRNVADAATTTNGLTLGGITSVDDVNTELIPNAKFRLGAAAFGLAVVELV